MESPPINSRTKEFALIKAYIPPKYKILDHMLPLEKSIENRISNIIDTKICKASKEKKILNQDLKNQDVEFRLKDRNAKGAIKTNTFIIIYRKEYEKTKLNNESVKIAFNRPSKENILIEDVSIDKEELILKINSWKEIFLWNKFSPNCKIADVIDELRLIICSTKK